MDWKIKRKFKGKKQLDFMNENIVYGFSKDVAWVCPTIHKRDTQFYLPLMGQKLLLIKLLFLLYYLLLEERYL